MARSEIHEEWVNAYRTPENAKFFEETFDRLTRFLQAPPDAKVLDVGCGTCAHAVRLARRGFRVTAIDISARALQMAQAHISAQGLQDRIRTKQASVLELPFADGSFSYVLCWGVLMHVPEVRPAIKEIARVLQPGGTLIVSEGNMASLQSRLRRWVKPNGRVKLRRTQAGFEYRQSTSSGVLLTRETDIAWLSKQFARQGLTLKQRLPGQLTELYTKTSSPIARRLIHGVNRLWASSVGWSEPAFGNILLFEKPAAARRRG